jgi:hypothetical protein
MIKGLLTACAGTAALLLAVGPAIAQDEDDASEVDALTEQVELLKAKTDLANARLDYAKVVLDQLPSYDGTVTTDSGTGKFESTLLAASAMSTVANEIANLEMRSPILVLAQDEPFAFGLPFALGSEMVQLRERVVSDEVCGSPCLIAPKPAAPGAALVPPAVAVAAIAALGGMLRSDVTLKNVDATAVDSAMLASAVAANINNSTDEDGQARVADVLAGSPGAKINLEPANLIAFNAASEWKDTGNLAPKYAWLASALGLARQHLRTISATARLKKANEKKIALLTQWIKDFEEFRGRATKAGDDAPAPLAEAIQAEQLESANTIIRVSVDLAGGTLKTSKNIATFFGADPMKITGGVLARYTVYDVPTNGRARPVQWGMWSCESDHLRLKEVRSASFTVGSASANAPNTCQQASPFVQREGS